MAYPCTDDPQEIIAHIYEAVDNSEKLDSFVNGTDSETVQLGSGDPTPTLRGVVKQMLELAEEAIEYDEDHPEYVRYYRDSDGRFLWGIKLDGSIEWAAGVPTPVKEFAERFTKNIADSGGQGILEVVDAGGKMLLCVRKDGSLDWSAGIPRHVREFVERSVKTVFIPAGQDIFSVMDADGRFLFGVHADGRFDWSSGVPKPVRDYVDQHLHVRHDAASSIVSSIEDSEGRAVRYMDDAGNGVNFGNETVVGDVKVSGSIDCDRIRGVLNWSTASSIKIPEVPKCATVNITGFSRPLTKQQEYVAVMEFWDGQGNYFRKNILIGLQGNSTWNLPKPNYKFDIIRGDWNDIDEEGDLVTCPVQFGDWIPGDSYHLKAFYTDFTKCRAPVSYKIWDEINKTYGYDKDATWKRAMLPADEYAPVGALPAFSCTQNLELRMDTGATCRFGSFPCIVYHNGEFYGIFSWQQKKDRKNFQMDKKNFLHIHLDGNVSPSLCAGNPDYCSFEIRNPKKLVCWDGSDYDGDFPMRLINRADAEWKNKSKFENTEITDQSIRALAAHLVEIGNMDKRIQEMIAGGAAQNDVDVAVANLKASFETYFDPENVIDMVVHLTWDNDTDSVTNNTQWTTWDGVKWYLNRYDANGAFRGNARWHPKPGPISHVMGGTTENHPFHIIEAYYFDEACARYAELRSRGILDADHFMKMVQDWMLAIGYDFYKKEFEKWPMQNCLGEMCANGNSWRLVLDGGGKPIRCDVSTASAEDQALPAFSLEETYQPGDVVKATYCYWRFNNQVQVSGSSGYWKMVCVAPGPCKGTPPFRTDFENAPESVYRLCSWIRLHQKAVDTLFGYNA